MKRLILFLLLLASNTLILCQTMRKEKYRAITYTEAIKLRDKEQGKFFKDITFNNASIFRLKDSSFLILPLNPFASSLLVYEEIDLEEMLKTNTFPVKDKINAFYESHKEKIENLNVYSQQLVAELNEYLKQNNFVHDKGRSYIDSAYHLLKTKKSLEKYKLNFIVFLANFIKETYDPSLKIGLLKDKQTLNPIVSIVLVKQNAGKPVFFNLEENVFGRSGYFGVDGVINSLAEFTKKPDGVFYVIDKIFE